MKQRQIRKCFGTVSRILHGKLEVLSVLVPSKNFKRHMKDHAHYAIPYARCVCYNCFREGQG